mmetsp:Transcript_24702/g.51262  ORF Transcript_24702/g.51262 Transcript_24702/m.51262 type:complete len:219 (+) Transcript_24702:70-726(+)
MVDSFASNQDRHSHFPQYQNRPTVLISSPVAPSASGPLTNNIAKLPKHMATPATVHAIPGIVSPNRSETYPKANGAMIYVPSPAALGNPNAVASAPTGAISCPNAVSAGPCAEAPVDHRRTRSAKRRPSGPPTWLNRAFIPSEGKTRGWSMLPSPNSLDTDKAKGTNAKLTPLIVPMMPAAFLAPISSARNPPKGAPINPDNPAADRSNPAPAAPPGR